MTTALHELYEQVTKANGWSMRDVARRSEERSRGVYGVSKSRIGQLVNAEPLESINAYAIHSLAYGLGISSTRVAVAAVESMGFPIASADITPAEAVMRDERLTEDTKRAVLSILRSAGEVRGA